MTITEENRLILQGFEWHTPSSPPAPNETHSQTSHYSRLTRLLPSLANLGVTTLWLPPGCKGNNPRGNGYDIYDLWDLGEFEQKGARSTKWGSREELRDLMDKGKECGIEMVWDAVLNHKAGADGTEECWAVEVDREDRRYEICQPKKIDAWLKFDFRGREQDGKLKYSDFRWRPEHFNGVDWDHGSRKKAIYKLIDDPSSAADSFQAPRRPSMSGRRPSSRYFRSLLRASSSSLSDVEAPPPRRLGKGWAEDVDGENGNNDYLMFSNIDYTHKEAREDVMSWGRWMIEDTGIDGFRLDAVQHFSFAFTRDWIQKVQEASIRKRSKDVFIVGEVWTGDLKRIINWLDAVQSPAGPRIYAYDSPLLYNFSRLSEDIRKRKADLRTVLRGSLLEMRPEAAVTLVTNHDTQPGQTSYTNMPSGLKPFWYAFILLRQKGLPCVFWGDVFGTQGPHAEQNISDPTFSPNTLPTLMLCRRLFAYGEQTDYWQSKGCIGWARAGTDDKPGCAVLFSLEKSPKSVNGIDMTVGSPGEVWIDVQQKFTHKVTVDEAGKGRFLCSGFQVSVWVKRDAAGIENFPVDFDVAAAS